MFRVLGSSKYRKVATLRLHAAGDDKFDFNAFLSTLVCPYPSLEATRLESPSTRLLRCSRSGSSSHQAGRPTLLTSTRVASSRAVECRQSVYPELDAFIRSQATRGGVQGEIRAIQMLFPPVRPPSEEGGEKSKGGSKPWMITYHVARNRWCGNVGRAHRSNNVMFVVDLSLRVYYQKCHDPACQALDYRYCNRLTRTTRHSYTHSRHYSSNSLSLSVLHASLTTICFACTGRRRSHCQRTSFPSWVTHNPTNTPYKYTPRSTRDGQSLDREAGDVHLDNLWRIDKHRSG